VDSHYWTWVRSRRNYVWLIGPINCPITNYFSTVHTRKYTPVKYKILSFIAFLRHNIHVQLKQNGIQQSMVFCNIQALFDMPQRSHNPRILILFFKICDKEINNRFRSVPLFKRFTYANKLNFVCLNTLQFMNKLSKYAINLLTLNWYRHAHVLLLASCVSFCTARNVDSGESLSLIRISKVAVFSQK